MYFCNRNKSCLETTNLNGDNIRGHVPLLGARDFDCTSRQAVQLCCNYIQKVFARYVSKSPERSNLNLELQTYICKIQFVAEVGTSLTSSKSRILGVRHAVCKVSRWPWSEARLKPVSYHTQTAASLLLLKQPYFGKANSLLLTSLINNKPYTRCTVN
jgi:hypothetical protein